MQRCKCLLLVCLLFLLIGCKKIDNTDDYITLVNNCLKDNVITNNVSLGYLYYVPKGARKVSDYDYNQVFLVDNEKIYLYVDIVSYYYGKTLNDNTDDEYYYYQKINYNDKTGYIVIKEIDDEYFIKIVYNYSKIETYVTSDNLNKVITISSIILNSINYNDVVIEKIMNGDLGEYSEITYEVEKPDDSGSEFSQLLEEYVQSDDETEESDDTNLPDE